MYGCIIFTVTVEPYVPVVFVAWVVVVVTAVALTRRKFSSSSSNNGMLRTGWPPDDCK